MDLARSRTIGNRPPAAGTAQPGRDERSSLPRPLLRALTLASRAVAERRSPDEVLPALLVAARATVGVDHGFVARLDDGGATMRLVGGDGLFDGASGRRFEPGTGLVGQVWSTAAPVVVEDHDSWTGRGIDVSADGAQALVGVPVRAADTVVGVLCVASEAGQRAFTAADVELLEALAHLVSTVLAHDEEAETARRDRAEHEAVADTARRLREQEQRVLDLVPAALWVKDRDNRILRANLTAARELGLPASSIENRFLWELDPENAARSYRRDLEVIETRDALIGELEERVGPDGEPRWARVDRTPLLDDRGDVEAIVVLARDITREHLAEGRVEAADRASDRARRMRSHALAALADEVRGPLRRVGEILEDLAGAVDGSVGSRLDEARRSMGRAAQCVEDLLDFERVEAGNLPVEIRPFSVGDLAEGVADLVSQAAHARDDEVAVHVDGILPPTLAGDEARTRQILVQLLAQAVRSTEGGEVLLTVRSVMSSDRRWEVRFEVHATEWALTARQLEARFGPYLHGDEVLGGEPAPGAVGLALAHRLVQVLGGAAGMEIDPDERRSFWCTLPFGPVDVPDAHPAPVEPCPGARVLVVEDRPTMAVVLERQLRDMAALVDLAATADEARSMIGAAAEDDWSYDCVLVDQTLDDFDPDAWVDALPAGLADRIHLLVPFGRRPRSDRLPTLAKPVHRDRLRTELVNRVGAMDPDHAESGTPGSRTPSARVLVVDDEPLSRRLTGLALQRLGCRAVSADASDVVSVADRDGPFDLVLLSDESERTGRSRVIEAIRRADGRGRHTPVVGVCRRHDTLSIDRCLAAGADTTVSGPLRHDELRALLDHVEPSGAAVGIER
ncbi:MAG TPA: GAF domain-containing protein [Candidatus Krumholzibacteria bacterium]|nr:GAF domain-containing protein [Candidatus Krumholzibacteria bacterium]